MKVRPEILAGVAILCLAMIAAAGGDNAKNIVGIWEVVKVGDKEPPRKFTIEFAKDGKVKKTITVGEKSTLEEGTYTVKDDKITLRLLKKDDTKEDTVTIKKLTDTELKIEAGNGVLIAEFKRIK